MATPFKAPVLRRPTASHGRLGLSGTLDHSIPAVMPHAKGPPVWMDLDQVELDAAYDQAFYAPLRLQVINRYASTSEDVRRRLGEPLRESYGPSTAEKLDIYRARRANAPIFLFIHGGAWLGGEAKNYAFPAEMFVNAGANYVVLDFIGVKEAAGDLRVMAEQVRRGIAWAYKNAGKFGGDASRLYVGGHSSGGHLCGVALVTDWEKDHALPADAVIGGSKRYDVPTRMCRRPTLPRTGRTRNAACRLARGAQAAGRPLTNCAVRYLVLRGFLMWPTLGVATPLGQVSTSSRTAMISELFGPKLPPYIGGMGTVALVLRNSVP